MSEKPQPKSGPGRGKGWDDLVVEHHEFKPVRERWYGQVQMPEENELTADIVGRRIGPGCYQR